MTDKYCGARQRQNPTPGHRFPLLSLLPLALALVVFLGTACSSSSPKMSPATDDTSAINTVTTFHTAPWWFPDPPRRPDTLFAATTRTALHVQDAINRAQIEARGQIASMLRVRFEGLLEDTRTQHEDSSTSELVATYRSTYRTVISEVLYGTRPVDRLIQAEGSEYRVYVLMAMPLQDAGKRLYHRIKENDEFHQKIRRQEMFAGVIKEINSVLDE